jgi:hypothetical protein
MIKLGRLVIINTDRVKRINLKVERSYIISIPFTPLLIVWIR